MEKKWMVVILNVVVFLAMGCVKAEPGSPKTLKKERADLASSAEKDANSSGKMAKKSEMPEQPQQAVVKVSDERRGSIGYAGQHFHKLRLTYEGRVKEPGFHYSFFGLDASNEFSQAPAK
jgi:hypothetical protein